MLEIGPFLLPQTNAERTELVKMIDNETGTVYCFECTEVVLRTTSRRSLLHWCDPRSVLRNSVVK
jgi:hypothetical protein